MSELERLTLMPVQLRNARRAVGLSQHELALRSGVGEKTISSFETGVRITFIKLAQLARIADACHVTVSELLAAPIADVEAHVKESRTVAAPTFKPKRGVTIYRSSDHLRSSLGDHQR